MQCSIIGILFTPQPMDIQWMRPILGSILLDARNELKELSTHIEQGDAAMKKVFAL